MKKITVRIKSGQIKIETTGFEGAVCLEETAFLKEGLGLLDCKDELKPEYFEQIKEKELTA